MLVRLSGEGPLYLQVYRALRGSILAGRAVPGSPLPATRLLAKDLGVSRNVVLIAYEQLVAEGYAEGRVGSGTYVSAALSRAPLPGTSACTARADGRRKPPRLSRYARRILSAPGRMSPVFPTPARKPHYDFQIGVAAVDDAPHQLWRRLIARRARHLSLDYGRSEGHASLQGAIADYL